MHPNRYGKRLVPPLSSSATCPVGSGTPLRIGNCREFPNPIPPVHRHMEWSGSHTSHPSDRYLTAEEIQTAASRNPLAGACAQAVAAGYTTYPELAKLTRDVMARTREAFEIATAEPKLTSRTDILERVAPRLAPVPQLPEASPDADAAETSTKPARIKRHVLRKCMNMVMDEVLTDRPDAVYIGEDVEHGGYYLVTENLKKKYPTRVRDFPPDETSLFGIGIGFSQAGVLPIVEMPYVRSPRCL